MLYLDCSNIGLTESGLTLPLRPRRTRYRSRLVDSLDDSVLGADIPAHPAFRPAPYVLAVNDRAVGRGITVLPYTRPRVGCLDITSKPGPRRVRARRRAPHLMGNRARDAAGFAPDEVHIEAGFGGTRRRGRCRVWGSVRAIRVCGRQRDVMYRKSPHWDDSGGTMDRRAWAIR